MAHTASRKEMLRRVFANLDLICEPQGFKDTQLVGSFLIPLLGNFDKFESGDPECPGCPNGTHNKTCLRKIRDALAHSNFVWLSDDSTNDISGIHFWTCPPRATVVDWYSDLDRKDLRATLDRAAAIIGRMPDQMISKRKGDPR